MVCLIFRKFIIELTVAATYCRMDPNTVLCSHLPKAVLLRRSISSKLAFPGLDQSVIPIFPINSSVPINGARLIRRQVPICPAFALTEYKVQGATFDTAVLDLQRGPKSQWTSTHKRFCSTYVQLSRLKTLSGIKLLAPIILDDVANEPKDKLIEEDTRLDKLSSITLGRLLGNSSHQDATNSDLNK